MASLRWGGCFCFVSCPWKKNRHFTSIEVSFEEGRCFSVLFKEKVFSRGDGFYFFFVFLGSGVPWGWVKTFFGHRQLTALLGVFSWVLGVAFKSRRNIRWQRCHGFNAAQVSFRFYKNIPKACLLSFIFWDMGSLGATGFFFLCGVRARVPLFFFLWKPLFPVFSEVGLATKMLSL